MPNGGAEGIGVHDPESDRPAEYMGNWAEGKKYPDRLTPEVMQKMKDERREWLLEEWREKNHIEDGSEYDEPSDEELEMLVEES